LTTETANQISIEEIRKYTDANIPIRPIRADGVPNVSNIFTNEEISETLFNLPEDLRKWVYKNDKLQPLKLLAVQPLSPKDFWTDERIARQNWVGIECQTGFNASLSCIVIGIDADDEKPKAIVRRLITEYGLEGKTIIQRTPHDGLHLIIKIPCKIEEIELWRKRALSLESCRNGCKIEIKTTTMGITLSPSRHRRDAHLSYTHESIITIDEVLPEFYLQLIDELKSNGCIWETPEEHYAKLEEQEKADFTSPDPNIKRRDLTDSEITDGINIILGKDGRGVNSAYVVGHRDNIVISLGGHFYYHYITLESVKAFIQKLGEAAEDSGGDIQSSLQKIDRTWTLGNNKERIRGKSGLITAFARLKDGDPTFGQERFALLEKALNLSETKIQLKESTVVDSNPDLKEKLEAELILKIPDRDYAEFLIETIKRTVKQEDSLVRQIVYTVLSKDTRNPLNLAVLAPTSEGKTYAVLQVLQFFLGPDIKKIGSMSPRVIIRQNGTLVDADNQPIADKIKDLKKRIRKAKVQASNKTKSKGKKTSSSNSEEKEDLEDLEEQLAQLYDDAKVLIDLQGKLWVFLEPPEKETWNILKTLLSHDSFEIEHPYVYELPGKGFSVKKVVTRGWPACIFCSAKNESDWPVWPEIQSRFLVTSPNMVQQKYLEGNILTAQRMGLPSLLQHQIIVSPQQFDLAKKCASYLIEQMTQFNKPTNPVWIPFALILGKVLPAEKGTDNRVAKRIFSFLSIITQSRAHLRGRLEYGNESLAIADMNEDFHEVLHITQNLSGVPPFKLRVFKEVLLPLYKSKQGPDKIEDGRIIREEKIIAVTTRQLCDYYKETIGRTITTDIMKKIYLDEFINNGLIDAIRSELDNRQNIYFPLVDTSIADNNISTTDPDDNDDNESKITKLSITTRLDNILQHSTIMVSKNYNKTAENWLELQIFSLLKYRVEIGHFTLFDKDGEQICPCKFIDDYQKRSDLTRYFSKPIFYNSDEKVFGDITKLSTVVEKECKKLSSENKLDNLVISEPVIKETPALFQQLAESLPSQLPTFPALPKDQSLLTSFGFAYTLEKCLTGESQNKQWEEKAETETDGIQLSSLPSPKSDGNSCPDHYMTGKFTTAYGQVKLEIHKQSAEKVSSYESEHFSLANIENSPDMITIAAITAITAIAKSRNFTSSQQQLVIVKERQPVGLLLRPLQPKSFIPLPIPTSLVDKVPELGRFAVFDSEWSIDLTGNQRGGDIYAFCLVDDHGTIERLHVSQFPDRRGFISRILDVIERYDTIAGYAILSDKDFHSDLRHLEDNCYQVGLGYRFSNLRCQVLDAYKIYHNETVNNFLEAAYKIKCRGRSLDAVAQAFLGKGKSEGISGVNAAEKSCEEQLSYCLQDAQLCYELLQQNNFGLLQILYEISEEIKLPFFETCNALWPTKWWSSKLESMGYHKVSADVQQWIDENTVWKNEKKKGVTAMGGHVFPIKTGIYKNSVCYDVVSMYPSMANIFNISTETINCSCCKNDPTAKIPDEVMNSINTYLASKKQKPRPWHYWICKQRGQFSDLMGDLIKRKAEYKRSGQTLKEKAIKLFMNSGYGAFKQPYFEFLDPRVAELITSHGQYTMKKLARKTNENVIYGDTDSIYLASKSDTLVKEAAKINVDLELDKEYKILFLSSNKKQYFGLTQEGKLVKKQLTGMKSDHPKYFREISEKLISKEIQELFITSDTAASEKIITYAKSAFEVLETEASIINAQHSRGESCSKKWLHNLAYSFEASKNLYDYPKEGPGKKLYREKLEDYGGNIQLAQSQSQANTVYEYWKVIGKGKAITAHPDRYQLDITTYRTELIKCITPILAGYGIKEVDGICKIDIDSGNSFREGKAS
jgi:DNA polymerase family B